jgi:hypothetical protein
MKIGNEEFLTRDELIKAINDEFGSKVINDSMLKYMRDVRGLLPKPIRIKSGKGKGGANSYYTKSAYEILLSIMEEKIENKKTLKDIEVELRKDIDLAVAENVGVNESLRKFKITENKIAVELPSIKKEVILKDLKAAAGAVEKGAKDEEVAEILSQVMHHYLRRRG